MAAGAATRVFWQGAAAASGGGKVQKVPEKCACDAGFSMDDFVKVTKSFDPL